MQKQSAIEEKLDIELKNFDDEVQEVLRKGLGYTENNQLSKVTNRLARDIEKLAKERS